LADTNSRACQPTPDWEFICAGVFYPSTEHYSTTRGDTVVILACGAGIHCASNFVYQYGIDL